jgi:Tol biopolymer transport system component
VAPAGDRLAFREGAGNLDIVSVDLATGSAATMIATERSEQQPHWSAERSLVYTTDRNGPIEIWLRRDGVPDRPLVTARDFSSPSPFFMLPTLSPRGERVVYARLEDQGTTRLWISPVDGGAPIRATSENSAGTSEFPGAWSPDGTWFAYYAAAGGKLNLMKVRTGGEAAPMLLKKEVAGGRLCDWSPTGEWIACGETLISPDGRTERSIGSHGSPYYAFSKDGRLLYGLRADNGRQLLFSIDIATGAERPIGSANAFVPRASLSPAIRFSLAPDGKSLVYGAGVIRASLWLLEGFAPPDGILARFGWRR